MKPRRSLAIGDDLVLTADENVHRGKWPVGKVMSFAEKTDMSDQQRFRRV